MLVRNISRTKSPALSIDFLIAVYLYSDHKPSTPLPHSKILPLPVIYERIWLLYLSRYRHPANLSCFEHIFASALTEDNYVRQMAS